MCNLKKKGKPKKCYLPKSCLDYWALIPLEISVSVCFIFYSKCKTLSFLTPKS